MRGLDQDISDNGMGIKMCSSIFNNVHVRRQENERHNCIDVVILGGEIYG